MKLRSKFIYYFATIFTFISITCIFLILNTTTIEKYLKVDVPNGISSVVDASQRNVTAQLIRYDDEVLTQSARNYAFTGDIQWKTRYFDFVPKFDLRISEALKNADAKSQAIFAKIDVANTQLVQQETEAIADVDAGNLNKAQDILNSDAYSGQKSIIQSGIDEYLAVRGTVSDQALVISTTVLDQSQNRLQIISKIQKYSLMGFVVLCLILLIMLFALITRMLLKPLSQFQKVANDVIGGNLNAKIEIKSKDEVGQFAANFNKMTATLRGSLENTESKVSERTADLEKLNKYMTGRELKMIELKKRVAELEKINKQ